MFQSLKHYNLMPYYSARTFLFFDILILFQRSISYNIPMNVTHHPPLKSSPRALLLDLIRGLAVLLMIIFHFSYDLNNLGFVKIDMPNHPFWYLFPRVIVFLFLFCTGISLTLAHVKKFMLSRYLKRILLLAGCSLLVSLSSYILFPEKWIYFGTLHCITFLSLIGPVFIKSPRISGCTGIALFIFDFLGWDGAWIKLAHPSLDYISPFPWMGAFLIGIAAAHFKSGQLLFSIKNVPRLGKIFLFLGKHSLLIYLIHQPIMFGLLLGIKQLFFST